MFYLVYGYLSYNICFLYLLNSVYSLFQSQCLANAPVLTMLLAPLQQVPKYSILLKVRDILLPYFFWIFFHQQNQTWVDKCITTLDFLF